MRQHEEIQPPRRRLGLRRDPLLLFALVVIGGLVVVALAAPLLAPHDPTEQFRDGLTVDGQPVGSSRTHPIGTDALGRDELSRLIYGARVSLAVAVLGNIGSAIIGVLLGGIAGMSRQGVQAVIMRGVDVVLSFPILLLGIAVLSFFRPGILTISGVIAVSFGCYVSRIVYAETVSLRERDFVAAARASGVSRLRILQRHILPHLIPSVVVVTALGLSSAVMLEATLSYVGIGIRPPEPSWGNMISDGQSSISTVPRLIALPGLAIVLTTLAFSLLGDALRDRLDPTSGRRLRGVEPGVGAR